MGPGKKQSKPQHPTVASKPAHTTKLTDELALLPAATGGPDLEDSPVKRARTLSTQGPLPPTAGANISVNPMIPTGPDPSSEPMLDVAVGPSSSDIATDTHMKAAWDELAFVDSLPDGVQYLNEHQNLDGTDSPAPSQGGNSTNIPVSIAPAEGFRGKTLAACGEGGQGPLSFLEAATSYKPISALKNLAQYFSAPPSANTDSEHDTRQPKNTHTLATNTIALIENFAQQHIPGFQNFQAEISSTCFVKETTINAPETFFAFPPLNGGGKGTMTTEQIIGKIKTLSSSPNFKGGIVIVQSHKSILFSPPESAIEFQKVMGGEPIVEALLALPSLTLTCSTLTPLDLLEVGLITKELTPRRLNMTLYLLLPPTHSPSLPRHVFVEVFGDELHPHTPIPPHPQEDEVLLLFGHNTRILALKRELNAAGIFPSVTRGVTDEPTLNILALSDEALREITELTHKFRLNIVKKRDLNQTKKL